MFKDLKAFVVSTRDVNVIKCVNVVFIWLIEDIKYIFRMGGMSKMKSKGKKHKREHGEKKKASKYIK